MIIKFLYIFLLLVGFSASAFANKVSLNELALNASTDNDGKYNNLNVRVCFRSAQVDNRTQKRNCLRLKTSITGTKQYENIIFETRYSQFRFNTNKRYGSNTQFWLKEKASEDTINFYSFLQQLSKTENALVGAMCKKVADMNWLRRNVRKAVKSSNRVEKKIFTQFEPTGYRDLNQIGKRCLSVVENKIGKVTLVKASTAKKTFNECTYTPTGLYTIQATLKELGRYKSKIDGKYGPGTEGAIIASKEDIFQFAKRKSKCLSAEELKWLQLLANVKRTGYSCSRFNTNQELKEIASLFEEMGLTVFEPTRNFSENRFYLDIVKAIIVYEESLNDAFFKIGQRARDCRLIPAEKNVLIRNANAESKATELAAQKAEEEKRKAEELAAQKAEEEKRKAEELAAQKAEEEKRKAEELAAQKAEEEKRKAEELAAQKAEEEKRKAEELVAQKAEDEKRKKAIKQFKERKKKAKIFQADASLLFNDIRLYFKSGKTLGIDFAVYFNSVRDAETLAAWNDEYIVNYKNFKQYVLDFADFKEFRKKVKYERDERAKAEILQKKKEIELVLIDIEEWITKNPFSEKAADFVSLLKTFKNNELVSDIKKLTNDQNMLISKAERAGIELENYKKYISTDKKRLKETKKNEAEIAVKKTLEDNKRARKQAKVFIEDLKAYVSKGNKFDLDFVYKFSEINQFLENPKWKEEELIKFRNFMNWCLSFPEFRAFYKNRESQGLIELKNRVSEMIIAKNGTEKYLTEWITKNAMEKNAPRMLDLTRQFRNCRPPLEIEDRLQTNKIERFNECLQKSIDQINSLNISTISHCSNLLAIGSCPNLKNDQVDQFSQSDQNTNQKELASKIKEENTLTKIDNNFSEIKSDFEKEKVPPTSQRFFIDLVEKTKASYNKNDTSGKKTLKWIKASQKLCSSKVFEVSKLKENWVGVAHKMYMSDNGDVLLILNIDDNKNRVKQNIPLNFLVRNRLEETITDIEKGDRIKFSGTFEKGNVNENECLDGGFFADPELLNEEYSFNYTKIEKLDGGRCNNFAKCFDYFGDDSSFSEPDSTSNEIKNTKALDEQPVTNQMLGKYPYLRGSQEKRIKNLVVTMFQNPKGISKQMQWGFKVLCMTASLDPTRIDSETKKAINYVNLIEGGSMRKTLLDSWDGITNTENIKSELKKCQYKYFE